MPTRVQLLAMRVRWLDRYRRLIAVTTAILVSAVLVSRLDSALGSDWPWAAATVSAFLLGVVAWWFAEVALAWITAFWETEYDQLLRDRGLPRAIAAFRPPEQRMSRRGCASARGNGST